LQQGGLVDAPMEAKVFGTLPCSQEVIEQGLHNWWYCMPRNGHISFCTETTLTLLAKRHGLQYGAGGNGLHVIFRPTIANWLRPLFRQHTGL
jgi:hypothetical protein